MVRMICLANSIRHDGRCVAGIDIQTGEWIRPVPPAGGGIPSFRTIFNNNQLSILDVVALQVNRPLLNTRFQRENRVMPNWNWQVVDTVTPQEVTEYCEDTSPILYSLDDNVSPQTLEQIPANEWKSLQLVRPRNLSFERDYWNTNRWRARFRDGDGNEYYLKITDPVICDRLGRNEHIGPNCLLTVSLTEPWAPDDGSKPELCYKLVAGVIEL